MIRKKTFGIALAAITFIVPGIAYADIKLNVPFGGTTSVSGLGEYLGLFYQYFVTGIGILAAFMIMFGGYRWITAAGNSEKITTAKDNIVSAVLGVFLALISFILLNLINPNIVELKIRIPGLAARTSNVSEVDGKLVFTLDYSMCPEIAGVKGGQDKIENFNGNIMEGDPDELNKYINKWGNLVDPEFLKAIIMEESDAKANADSSGSCPNPAPGGVCACGITQFRPDTAKKYNSLCNLGFDEKPVSTDYDVEKEWQVDTCNKLKENPLGAICAAAYHINDLDEMFHDPVLVAAAYNAGAGANGNSVCCPGLRKWQCEWDCIGEWTKNTGYAETRNYVEDMAGHIRKICKQSG